MIIKSIAICLVMAISACNQNEPDFTQPFPVGDFSQVELESAMLDFGFKAFYQINQTSEETENILISPLSIETALYMTNNGALNETQREITKTLELEDSHPDLVNLHYQSLALQIREDATDETFLNQSQAVFWSDLMHVDPEFRSKLENFYDADFRADQFDLESINGWAEEKTEGRIPKVLEEIQEDEVMFLLNALYFLGDWNVPFAPEGTIKKDFHIDDNESLQVDMMHHDHPFHYYKGDDLNAVDLAFSEGKFAMTFIQPTTDVNDFIGENSFEEMSSIYESLIPRLTNARLKLSLPKFELEYKRNITEDLKALGMPKAFSENAELSGLGTAGGHIYLSRVLHDTYLKIDEKGAEGAAVTTVGVAAESLPPSISLDRPFLFVLRHVDSGVPIFIGKIMDPTK